MRISITWQSPGDMVDPSHRKTERAAHMSSHLCVSPPRPTLHERFHRVCLFPHVCRRSRRPRWLTSAPASAEPTRMLSLPPPGARAQASRRSVRRMASPSLRAGSPHAFMAECKHTAPCNRPMWTPAIPCASAWDAQAQDTAELLEAYNATHHLSEPSGQSGGCWGVPNAPVGHPSAMR